MPSASGVRTTSAPSARMILTFSSENRSGTNSLHLVSAIHADQRQPDPRIPRRRSTIVPPGRELPFLLRPPDDPNRSPVFHAAARIQILQLGKNVRRSGRNQPLQLQHGSFADQLGNVVGDAQAGHFRIFRAHLTGYEVQRNSSIAGGVAETVSTVPKSSHSFLRCYQLALRIVFLRLS